MATHTWTGATGDGSWATAGNWSGGVPVAPNPVVVIDDSSTEDIVAGLDPVIDLDSFTLRGFTGKCGISPASPLKIGCSGRCDIRPGDGGEVYLDDSTADLEEVYIEHTRPTGIVSLNGVIGKLLLRRGNVTIEAGTLTNVWMNALNGDATQLMLAVKGGTFTNLYGLGGMAEIIAAATFTNVYWDLHQIVNRKGTVTNYYVRRFGKVDHRNGNVTLLEVFPGGVFDGTRDARAKTVTTTTLHPGGRILLPSGVFTITVNDPLGFAVADYGGAPGAD